MQHPVNPYRVKIQDYPVPLIFRFENSFILWGYTRNIACLFVNNDKHYVPGKYSQHISNVLGVFLKYVTLFGFITYEHFMRILVSSGQKKIFFNVFRAYMRVNRNF